MGNARVGMQCEDLGGAATELRRDAQRLRRLHDDIAQALRSVDRSFPAAGAIVGAAVWAANAADDVERRVELMVLWDSVFPGIPLPGQLVACWAPGGGGGPLERIVDWLVDNVWPWWKGDDDTFPIIGWLTSASTVVALLRGQGLPVFPNTPLGRWLTGIGGDSRPFALLADSSSFFGKVSIAGALYTGATATASLVERGNPADAAVEDPAGFAADAAGAVFGAAEAVALASGEGTPPALGAHVVAATAGAVYLGAEIWDHADDLGKDIDGAGRWVGDRFRDAGGVVRDTVDGLLGIG